MDFLPSGNELLRWLLAALLAAGVLGSISATVAALVMRIPVIGPVLAALIPPIMAQYEKWLSERLKRAADAAVSAVERHNFDTIPKPLRSEIKRSMAAEKVNEAVPEARKLRKAQIMAQIEAAVERMKYGGN